MKSRTLVAIILSAALLVVPIVASAMTAAECHDLLRKLWTDHVVWHRFYIISALSDLPDKSATATRLMQNQTDIGNAAKAFYGDAGGAKLTDLLKQHVTIGAEVIDAAKAGDTAKKDAAMKRWQTNADELAKFLNSANPKNWPLQAVQTLLKEHMDLMVAIVTARLQKDWAGDIAAYDKAEEQILKIADALSAGIVAQFPDKFAAAK